MQQTNETAKYKKQQKDDIQIDKLKDVFGDLNEFNTLIKQYGCHIALSSMIMDHIEQQNLKQMTDLEYTLVSGIGENGEKITKETKTELIEQFIKRFPSDQKLSSTLRLALIARGSIVQETNAKDQLSVSEREYYVAFSKLVSKYGNYWPEEKKNELRDLVKKKYDESPTSLHRYYSKLEYCLDQVLGGQNESQYNTISIGKEKKQ